MSPAFRLLVREGIDGHDDRRRRPMSVAGDALSVAGDAIHIDSRNCIQLRVQTKHMFECVAIISGFRT
jgi:hypothetical protein